MFTNWGCAAWSNYPRICGAFHEIRLCQNLPDIVVIKSKYTSIFKFPICVNVTCLLEFFLNEFYRIYRICRIWRIFLLKNCIRIFYLLCNKPGCYHSARKTQVTERILKMNLIHASLEFSLNDFLWFQRIQWIMTKSMSSMVTRGITHLPTDILPVLVIQSVFPLLPLGRYLLPFTTLNRYQPTDSRVKSLFTTISRNVSIFRYRISLVTILLLYLVVIHWIQRKSLRENLNDL